MTPALVVPVLGRKLYPGASVALDFTRNLYRSGTPVVRGSPSLLSGWTFTRASTGYAETAAGALVAFASGAPRITDKGLLVEEARTNYNTYSNALSAGTGNTVTSAVGSAPDGTITAQRISKTDATTPRYVSHPAIITVAAATTYTVSRFFKYDGHDTTVSLEFNSGAYWNLGWVATFTVTASGITANAPTLCTSGVQALADGWYRCWATFTSGAAPTGVNGNPFLSRITGASGVSVQTFGSNLELGAFPTSYIPTTTAAATRAADVPQVTGLGALLGADFTLYAEASFGSETVSEAMAYVGGATINDRLGIYRSAGITATGQSVVGGVGSTAAFAGFGGVRTIKGAIASFAASSRVSFDGQAAQAIASAKPTALDKLFPGLLFSTPSTPLNGYVRRIIIYPRAFSDAELQAATT